MNKTLIVFLLCAFPLLAQEPPKKPTPAEVDAMIDFYVDAAKPVDEHKRLMELAGPWKVTTRLWFDPAGEPKTATGKGAGKMILGGRFLELETDVKGGGIDSETLTIMGFDRRTSEFTMIGLDTLGTYYITAAGKADPELKGVKLAGSYLQPPSNAEQKYFFVWTTPSAREHVLTLYFVTGGADVRVAETRLVRESAP